ncbi:hypothetical protein AMATHDRAFT_74429 [Amanita thiersii Skay4041]|uniref:Major facilitator superfamily (MFS) profile domain-containing protein n=1 Tax=Amanita thiersii Skay4041 TaxID=703135 RepID=A0A2A9NV33_9AGAR|nr:hypothetical protein AMATHDRAFT_74429 [Amanita thiersii Skay4041]
MEIKTSQQDIQITDKDNLPIGIDEQRTVPDSVHHIHLLPLLSVVCALALVDRTNLGIARVAGMDKDLGTFLQELDVGSRFSIVSLLYFPPYILLQLPYNLCIRKFGASNFIAFSVVAWGAAQLAMGFVSSWKYLALCRVLLGAFETGFFPALIFVISTWYIRHEVQKRFAIFYLLTILAAGFSPILAYLLTLLGGKLGISAWAWIFIVEGAITIAFGIFSWRFIPDFPDRNTFLNAEQTQLVLRRVEEDRGDSIPDAITVNKVKDHLRDWKIWTFAMMYFCATAPAYVNGFFMTIILKAMGWSVRDSMLLSTPPYIVAGILNVLVSWASDVSLHRVGFIAVEAVITIIGLVLTGFTADSGWRYTGLFLSTAGSICCIAGILAYSSNNVISHSKKAVMTALVVSFGGLGGIFATSAFRQQDFPKYIPGLYATIGSQILLLCLLIITTVHFLRQNDKARNDASILLEGQPGFLYTL